jgi:hypothetical protein
VLSLVTVLAIAATIKQAPEATSRGFKPLTRENTPLALDLVYLLRVPQVRRGDSVVARFDESALVGEHDRLHPVA